MTASNLFSPAIATKVDPYALNGLADHLREAFPRTFGIATRVVGTAPKLFGGGQTDLPAITSAGFDPELIKQVPWQARHYVAAIPDTASAHAAIERFAADATAVAEHEGLNAARSRIEAWIDVDASLLSDADRAVIDAERASVMAAHDAELYSALYGADGVVGGVEAARTSRMQAYGAAQTQYARQ